MTQTGQPAGFPGLLDPNVVLRRHVEDVSARFAGTVSPETVERMVFESCAALGRTARGMTVTDALPKPLTDDVVQAADMVITMGRGDACPVYPGKRYLDWHVTDPAGQLSPSSTPSPPTSRPACGDCSQGCGPQPP